MKKFNFALDKVLDFKEQVENNLKNEYAQSAARVAAQERRIEELEKLYDSSIAEFEDRKRQGCSINVMLSYERYFYRLNQEIEGEKEVLAQLKVEQEKKRREMVAAKIETSSFEKLKEKKQKEYNKEYQKQEEKLIEEFVANTSSAPAAQQPDYAV